MVPQAKCDPHCHDTSTIKRCPKPSAITGFLLPSQSEIAVIQGDQKCTAPVAARPDSSSLHFINGMVRIPTDCIDIMLLLLKIAHAGSAGHQGSDATFNALWKYFTWKDQRDDTCAFFAPCILCILAKSGNKILRPLSTTLQATMAQRGTLIDYIFPGDSVDDRPSVYALRKDDLSSYFWLDPSAVSYAAHTAILLAHWNRVFITPYIWVSYKGNILKTS